MTIPSATQHTYPYQNEPIWSKSEKLIARTVFEKQLRAGSDKVVQRGRVSRQRLGFLRELRFF